MSRILIHIAVLIVMPPLLQGVIVKTKALFAGRVGAPILQPYYDLFRLLRKDSVTSNATTWMFAAGSIVALATAILAGLFMPMAGMAAPLQFTGDMILVAYLFGLGRFCTTSSALDTGSAFEGMGSARELTFASFTEPALFVGFLALCRLSGSFSLSGMLNGALAHAWPTAGAALVMLVAGLFVILLAENCRIPFDDPNTHLELTMIHEVMVLDHSGPAFGLILYGAAVKLFVLGCLVVRLALPVHYDMAWMNWAVFLAGMVALAVLVGVVESVMARLRLIHVPNLLVAAGLLLGFGFLLSVRLL